MKKNGGVFVKINYKMDLGLRESLKKENRQIINNTELTKYLYCAGVYNKNGGTMIFKANNLQEAQNIIDNNPFSKNKIYTYEILSRDSLTL